MFFHDYIMTWWQAGMLKIALIAFGIILGASWPTVFKRREIWWTLWTIWAVFFVWLIVAFWPQI